MSYQNEVNYMKKKKGTDLEITLKIKMFLDHNRGQAFAVDRLARELGVGWKRIKRLLKVAEKNSPTV